MSPKPIARPASVAPDPRVDRRAQAGRKREKLQEYPVESRPDNIWSAVDASSQCIEGHSILWERFTLVQYDKRRAVVPDPATVAYKVNQCGIQLESNWGKCTGGDVEPYWVPCVEANGYAVFCWENEWPANSLPCIQDAMTSTTPANPPGSWDIPTINAGMLGAGVGSLGAGTILGLGMLLNALFLRRRVQTTRKSLIANGVPLQDLERGTASPSTHVVLPPLALDKQRLKRLEAAVPRTSTLRCGISGRIPLQPVSAPDGRIYERSVILKHIEDCERAGSVPLCPHDPNTSVRREDLRPDLLAREVLEQWSLAIWKLPRNASGASMNKIPSRFLHVDESELICPVSLVVPTDPVTGPQGHLYNREDIERWITAKGGTAKCPKDPSVTLTQSELRESALGREIVARLASA